MSRFTQINPSRGSRIHWAAAVLAAVAIVLSPPVAAQENDELTPEEQQLLIDQAIERSFEGEVTVTGSLIPRADLTALSPVSVMEVPTELTYTGKVRIEDLVVQMPQAFAGQNSTVSNGASGTATIDLRHLGTFRTLVLMNGRRLPPGDVLSYAPDINVVPAPLVKRVDVLTGGASTVYGSDAMAGVVNFVLDTEFEGVRGGFQYSVFQHDNNNAYMRQINEDIDAEYPTGSSWDGDTYSANVAVGGKFADGKGHASAYIDYRKVAEVRKGTRDYLNCAPWWGDDGPICSGSATTPWGTFIDNGGNFWMLGWQNEGYDGHEFVPWDGRVFNYAPDNFVQRPDEKWNTGAFVNYKINDYFDVYMEIMYMNNQTDAQIAYSGNFWNTEVINCDNPMLSEQQYDVICAQQGYGPHDQAFMPVLRRNVEGEPRNSSLGHTNVRILGGVRGDLGDNWAYDFYYMRGQNNQHSAYENDLHQLRVQRALNVIEDPETGEWVCANNADDDATNDDNCVPWNIFQEGAVTQDAINYISTALVQWGLTRQEVLNLTLNSDWENYGVALPGASEGVQVALGAEYRQEKMKRVVDDVYANGWATGGGGAQNAIDEELDVTEGFVEMLVPILQDVKGAQDLSLELGYRYSDYSTSGGVSTYKAQMSYAPTQSVRFRGGYNRAIRAANILELYLPQGYNLSGSTDPCGGTAPTASFAQCQLTGMTAAQYGTAITQNPAGQYNVIQGGNPALDPETADTITAGVVWTPQSIRGLSVTVDYYNMDITEVIGTLSYEQILNSCLDTGDPTLCSLIHRDELGTLWKPNGGYIETTNQNIGNLLAEGIDLNANYLLGLGDAGYLAMDLQGSYVLSNNFSNPLVDYDCAGYFGFICGDETAKWRHRFRATWESSFRLNLSLAWRYLDPVQQDLFSDDSDLAGSQEERDYEAINWMDEFPAYNWFDLSASYTLSNGMKFTVGCNNVTDEEPPFGPNFADNPVYTLHGSYEPLGRYFFASAQFNF